MTAFDAAGGPWAYRVRFNQTQIGLDLYIDANTFSRQPTPVLQGTVPDQTIYAGIMSDGLTTFVMRHNWFNQGAMYRAITGDYPKYPDVAVISYYDLLYAKPISELVIQRGGMIDLAPLLGWLKHPYFSNRIEALRALKALFSGCAVASFQRDQLGFALGLNAAEQLILSTHGVVVQAEADTITQADYRVIDSTLRLLPDPIKDELHLVILDNRLPLGVLGGYTSGGIVSYNAHSSKGGFNPYPSGRQVPGADRIQLLLIHEIGHMCDDSSAGPEQDRYKMIYMAGANDPNAFLFGKVQPPYTEDIITFFIGYCTDSKTILEEVAARGNQVLSNKLSHTIDLLPSVVPGMTPFFVTNPNTGVTTTSLVPTTRGPAQYLGDDGMITAVNGIKF